VLEHPNSDSLDAAFGGSNTPQPLPPLGVSPLSPPSPPSYYETYYIRILRPSKRLPFRSSKVNLISAMEKGYKYSHQPLAQPADSSLPLFMTYLYLFQRRNSFNPNYRPLSLFYSFSIYLYFSLLRTLVALHYSLTTLLLLHRRSTYYYYTPPTYSPTSLYCHSPLPFYLLSPHPSFSILLFIIRLIK